MFSTKKEMALIFYESYYIEIHSHTHTIIITIIVGSGMGALLLSSMYLWSMLLTDQYPRILSVTNIFVVNGLSSVHKIIRKKSSILSLVTLIN